VLLEALTFAKDGQKDSMRTTVDEESFCTLSVTMSNNTVYRHSMVVLMMLMMNGRV
jgi:hypothetical protein